MNRKTVLLSLLIVLLVSVSFVLILESGVMQAQERGFKVYSLQNNALLLSDPDIVSYSWTSQEMTITPGASERLKSTGDLYNWTGFVIKIDGEEVYRGVFRSPIMSEIPSPPRISVMFPSVFYPSSSPNYGALTMFYPSFQPPNDQAGPNAKIMKYFEDAGKLTH